MSTTVFIVRLPVRVIVDEYPDAEGPGSLLDNLGHYLYGLFKQGEEDDADRFDEATYVLDYENFDLWTEADYSHGGDA